MQPGFNTASVGIVLVDDHLVVREGLRAMLDRDPTITVVGEAGTGEEALHLLEQVQPDVVLLDIQLPDMDGIEATRRIKAAQPKTAVILVTMYDSELYVVEGVRAGAGGYLTKDCSADLLCYTIHAVIDGGATVRSSLLLKAIQGVSAARLQRQAEQQAAPPTERLTERELEVLQLVAQGYQNKGIASTLGLAEVTVKKHVQSVMAKWGVSDRTQAAVLAVRRGLVQ